MFKTRGTGISSAVEMKGGGTCPGDAVEELGGRSTGK